MVLERDRQQARDLGRACPAGGRRFLEIGSYRDVSTCWLLENVLTHPEARITCIDVSFQPVFELNLQQTGCAAKVEALSGPSYKFLRELPLSHYDFIYVDGSHMKRDVIEDAVLAWRVLKRGDLVTFDDYQMTDSAFIAGLYGEKGPEVAIDCFLSCYAGEYRVVHKGYQITLESSRRHEEAGDSGSGIPMGLKKTLWRIGKAVLAASAALVVLVVAGLLVSAPVAATGDGRRWRLEALRRRSR